MIVRCWRLEGTLRGVESNNKLVARFTTEEEAHKSIPFLVGEGVGGKVFPETIEVFNSSKAWCLSQDKLFRLSGLKKLTDLEKQALGLVPVVPKEVNSNPCGVCGYLHFSRASVRAGSKWGCCLVGDVPVVRKKEDVVKDCKHFGDS